MFSKDHNSIDDYLEACLNEWAEWSRTGNSLGLGYPRKSAIALFSEGKSISQNKTVKTISTNESSEIIEKMLAEMAQYKPIMADCLRYYYLNQQSLRNSAKKLGVSHTQYKLYVQMAKQWLVGRSMV